ncbi:MAG TPA: hypothetical protein VD926_13115, partial [Acidimicrobiales bacterium]|nr:hypothetical protein [Acidimicrobiales bacterium]
MLPILARDAVVAGMAPGAILATGFGAALGVLVGGGLAGAVVLAVVAWLLATLIPVYVRHLRRRGPGPVDPFSLREPWRTAARQALQAQDRFRQATASVAPGPLRDRLTAIGEQMARGAEEAGRVARRGQRLEDVRRQIDSARVLGELQRVEAVAGVSPGDDASLERTAEALRAQLATADRLDRVLNDTRNRLVLLDARLDEAVARTLELSVDADDPGQLG